VDPNGCHHPLEGGCARHKLSAGFPVRGIRDQSGTLTQFLRGVRIQVAILAEKVEGATGPRCFAAQRTRCTRESGPHR
jgi:hypothetical protein